MSALVVIPARYGAVRFPGKPLALLKGKPMIQHVYEGAARAARAAEVVVATDDERIAEAVKRFGGRAELTSPSARSGTERAAEVARTREAGIVVNVQGDEPLVRPEQVDALIEFLERHAAVPMASLMTALKPSDLDNPNAVKVVVDREGFALYFSRAPIPHARLDGVRPPRYKHLGLYGYQRHFLLQFAGLPPTPLEQAEQLEQLRALEHGYRIKLLETAYETIGVDTPEDLKRVEDILSQQPVPSGRR